MPDRSIRVLDRDRVRLHYERHGEAADRAPVLLTHGFASSSASWQPNLGPLSARRQVITWDMRGHGRTRAPLEPHYFSAGACVEDMAAILDACEAPRAVCAGLSLGGYLSLAFWRAHPDRVVALGLFDTGPGFRSEQSRARWNRYATERAGAFEQRGLAALPDSPEARLGPHDPAGLALAARGILTQTDAAVIGSLGSIAVPVLVLVGQHDVSFHGAADYLASHIPGAAKHVLAGAGHASNIDQPGEFNRTVLSYLETVD
jgi:pimeloyl-ACP methyl ester carboxylesterase